MIFFFWRLAQVLSHHFSRCVTKHFIEMTERSFHRGFPLPVVLPYCGPRCTTPVVGSKSSSHSLKKWWLRTCAHLPKKIFHKNNLWFSIFSFDLYTDSILKQVNKLKILKKVLGCNVLYFNLMQYMYVRSDYLGLVPLWWQTISKSFACMYCNVMYCSVLYCTLL